MPGGSCKKERTCSQKRRSSSVHASKSPAWTMPGASSKPTMAPEPTYPNSPAHPARSNTISLIPSFNDKMTADGGDEAGHQARMVSREAQPCPRPSVSSVVSDSWNPCLFAEGSVCHRYFTLSGPKVPRAPTAQSPKKRRQRKGLVNRRGLSASRGTS